MRRTTFDALLAFAGLGLAILLIVAGSLLTWGYTFTNNQVHNQLAAQQIFFPAKGSPSLSPKEFPGLQQYAGQQVVTGQQAEAYADQFIATHLKAIGGGKTYSQLSAESLAQPANAKLAATVQTMFRGTTLRGLLLNAYAFWKIGQIALIAAIVAFAGAGLMLILSVLGLIHLRRTSPQVEVLSGVGAHARRQAA